MIEIIPIKQAKHWDEIVSAFPDFDVYYLSGYVKAFQIHGDGEPVLIRYIDDCCQFVSAMFKRDISNHPFFKNYLKPNTYFDIITPYGYGGFITDGYIQANSLQNFIYEYDQFLKDNNIISSFTRFHPLLQNVEIIREVLPVIDLGITIDIKLDSVQSIWNNMSSKNRNMIRKAQNSGIKIEYCDEMEMLLKFKNIYDATMTKDNAEEYYFFSDEFYNSIYSDLKGNFQIFYAVHEGKVVSMSIILFANQKMHYHLSGSDQAYRHLAPTNLLLFEAACWGHQQGFKTFHLGGGLGSGEDNLYRFKKAFNPKSTNQFSIGKHIVDSEKYEDLKNMRIKFDPNFNDSSNFFPIYRA